MSPEVCCHAAAVHQVLLCPLSFSLDCPALSATVLLFSRFCSYFSSNCSISRYLHVLHRWWRYFCWSNVSIVVYNKMYSLIDLGGVPFSLVCANQVWTTHHISQCGPCSCCPLHSVLIGHWCRWYICRLHPRGHGVIDLSSYFSLVLRTTIAIPTSNHRAVCSHGQYRPCPVHYYSNFQTHWSVFSLVCFLRLCIWFRWVSE